MQSLSCMVTLKYFFEVKNIRESIPLTTFKMTPSIQCLHLHVCWGQN